MPKFAKQAHLRPNTRSTAIWPVSYDISSFQGLTLSVWNCWLWKSSWRKVSRTGRAGQNNPGPPCRGGSSPKRLGALSHQPLHHRVHFLCSPKLKKYELHIGLHLKSIISRVANSVMGYDPETHRNQARRAESGVGFLSQPVPSPSARESGGALYAPQRNPWRSPGKFGFWSILEPLKSRQNGQLAFESGGQQVNLGARATCPNVEPPLGPHTHTSDCYTEADVEFDSQMQRRKALELKATTARHIPVYWVLTDTSTIQGGRKCQQNNKLLHIYRFTVKLRSKLSMPVKHGTHGARWTGDMNPKKCVGDPQCIWPKAWPTYLAYCVRKTELIMGTFRKKHGLCFRPPVSQYQSFHQLTRH